MLATSKSYHRGYVADSTRQSKNFQSYVITGLIRGFCTFADVQYESNSGGATVVVDL